jgi:hypothetical protein
MAVGGGTGGFYTSAGSATGGPASGGGAAGGSAITVTCNCAGRPIQVYLDGKEIWTSMQKHSLTHSRRNGVNGLSLQAGR